MAGLWTLSSNFERQNPAGLHLQPCMRLIPIRISLLDLHGFSRPQDLYTYVYTYLYIPIYKYMIYICIHSYMMLKDNTVQHSMRNFDGRTCSRSTFDSTGFELVKIQQRTQRAEYGDS